MSQHNFLCPAGLDLSSVAPGNRALEPTPAAITCPLCGREVDEAYSNGLCACVEPGCLLQLRVMPAAAMRQLVKREPFVTEAHVLSALELLRDSEAKRAVWVDAMQRRHLGEPDAAAEEAAAQVFFAARRELEDLVADGLAARANNNANNNGGGK